MSEVYLAINSMADVCLAPIETIVALFTIKYCESSINIKLILYEQKSTERAYTIDLSSFVYEVVSEVPSYISLCELPNVTVNKDSCAAGLCTVLRQIVRNAKYSTQSLLGFKGSCLMACSETSLWTKFCEVDLILTLKCLDIQNSENSELPASLARFEYHMSQPVKLHNLYKYTMCKKFAALDLITHDSTGLPEHVYAEGSYVTLADIIIFVCMHILLSTFSSQTLSELIPLTVKWYNRMLADQIIVKCLSCLPTLKSHKLNELQYKLPAVVNESLYKNDPKRFKPRSRMSKKQKSVERLLGLIEDMKISIELDARPFGMEINLDWSNMPFDVTPEGGSLPRSRQKRKQEQLQNLCKPVLKLAKAGDIIVDFCSGSGHLGILIAYLLPRCTIILLENKEQSLNRAKERVKKLKLENVRFCQCNLDYFKGDFNIGTSLHACGVATDLVIQCCIQKNAIFISCPCCYGSLQDCHQLTYPRSEIFKERLSNKEYSLLSHAADQTHVKLCDKTKQGYHCMSIIDTDRKLFAKQFGYQVYLGKLVPETCTVKNHLLVGIPKSKPAYSDSYEN